MHRIAGFQLGDTAGEFSGWNDDQKEFQKRLIGSRNN